MTSRQCSQEWALTYYCGCPHPRLPIPEHAPGPHAAIAATHALAAALEPGHNTEEAL